MFTGISGESPESPFFVLKHLFATILPNTSRMASRFSGLPVYPESICIGIYFAGGTIL